MVPSAGLQKQLTQGATKSSERALTRSANAYSSPRCGQEAQGQEHAARPPLRARGCTAARPSAE
eukprot:13459234-Alexandrium_andersonii.AAC.1